MLSDDDEIEVDAAMQEWWPRMAGEKHMKARLALIAELSDWNKDDVMRALRTHYRTGDKAPLPKDILPRLPRKQSVAVVGVRFEHLLDWCKANYQIGMDSTDAEYIEAHLRTVAAKIAAYTYKPHPRVTFGQDGTERRTRPLFLVPLDDEDEWDIKVRAALHLRSVVAIEMTRLGCNPDESMKWVDDIFGEYKMRLPAEGVPLETFKLEAFGHARGTPKRKAKMLQALQAIMATEAK